MPKTELTLNAEVVVDRVEGDVAVLEAPDGTTFDVPLSLLPPDLAEGWSLKWSVGRSEDAETTRRASIEARLRRLTGG